MRDPAPTAPTGDGPDAALPAAGPGRRRRLGRFELWLGLIALGGLVLRVAYIWATRDDTSLCDGLLCGDALFYGGQANTIALGHGFHDFRNWDIPAADHPPLTALFLAPVAVFFSGTPPVVPMRVWMAIAGAAVIVAIGYLGRKVGGRRGEAVGLIAAAIAAINANFWMNDVLLMSETLATLGIALVLLAVYRFIDSPSVGRAAALGALVGLAGLARAELLLLLPVTFLPVALLVRRQPLVTRVGRIAVAGVAAVAVLAPWVGFNLTRFDEPVLLSTNDGLTLIGANCDDVYGEPDPGGIGFWQLRCAYAVADRLPPGADQSVVSGIYRRAGVDYIVSHKKLLPKVEAIRLARAWGVFGPDQMAWLNQGEGRVRWASWTGYVQWWLLIVPAVGGLVVLRRRRVPIWPLASTAVVVTITVAAFYGIVRFRLPADVAAVVAAAVAIDAVVLRLRRRTGAAGGQAGPPPPDPRPDESPELARTGG